MPNQNTWQSIHQRGQQSDAVWNQFNATFKVGALTLTLHQADVAALPGAAQAVADQQDVLDGERAARDTACATVKDLATRLPRVLDGALDPGDPLHGDLEDIRVIEMTGLDTILSRGQRALSVWMKVNAKFAAMTPPRPAVLVGALAVGDLSAALSVLPVRTQLVEDARAEMSATRSALRAAMVKADSGNKRWYAAWEGTYPVGTPERDALSQIDTGSSTTPAPEPLEIAGLAGVDATTVEITYETPGGGEHATELVLQWHLAGDVTWPHQTEVSRPSQTVTMQEFATGTITFRTRGGNSTGEAFSQEQQIELAPPGP